VPQDYLRVALKYWGSVAFQCLIDLAQEKMMGARSCFPSLVASVNLAAQMFFLVEEVDYDSLAFQTQQAWMK
jgi:hypothetical protein